eukprot:jgi/Astpho2/1347/fgenesh1_pg.00024_%23_35_t
MLIILRHVQTPGFIRFALLRGDEAGDYISQSTFAKAHGAKQGEEHKPAAQEKRQGMADLLEGPPKPKWPELFERQRLYGITVHKSRHPGLNDYIHSVVTSLKDALHSNTLHKVAINILDGKEGLLVERYWVHMQLGPAASDTLLDGLDLEHQLRGFLLKLQFADAWMKPLPQGCTFEVAAYTSDRQALSLQLWAEEVEAERRLGAPEPLLTPIKSANVGKGVLRLQLLAEC